jgi:hypothetical protein
MGTVLVISGMAICLIGLSAACQAANDYRIRGTTAGSMAWLVGLVLVILGTFWR